MTSKAPLWHLGSVVFILLALSAASGFGDDWRPEQHAPHAVVLIYLFVILLEWSFALFVLWRWPWRPENRWRRRRLIPADIATATAFSLVFVGVAKGAVALFGPDAWGSPSGLLPRGALELAAWVALSISAGICEEIIFRGYLLQQLALRTRSSGLAIIGQAVLFGASHGYQSVKSMTLIMVLGVLYGLLVAWRKTLVPGMLAHAGLDIAGVILG